jgi:predicted dehydrogenase
MKTIKWGIISTGNIASQFATALISMEDTKLMAVASRNQDRADEFAKRFHIEKAYAGYENLAKDPEIDVIYIGVPHTEHRDAAALCMKNGKAVLCEKPITLNEKDTRYLISLAKECGVFLMEAMWTKFLPATKTVKGWLQNKLIGEVKFIRASFGFYKDFDENSRLFNPNLAGGALLDVGIYPVTYAVHMLDMLPDKIVSSAYLGKSNVDEINVITFYYKDGILADLSSAVSVNMGGDAVIYGDKGKIVIPSFWSAESASAYDMEGNLIDSFSSPFKVNGYVYEAEEVNSCIREGRLESNINPLMNTLDIMKILDEIRAQWGLSYPQEQIED